MTESRSCMIQKTQIKACKMYASGTLKTPMQLKEPFDNRETLSPAIQINISEKEDLCASKTILAFFKL